VSSVDFRAKFDRHSSGSNFARNSNGLRASGDLVGGVLDDAGYVSRMEVVWGLGFWSGSSSC
jgi:hypothetical protein